MVAEIISVGTELLMGQILNSNAQFLAQTMSELGINLYHQDTVGDNMQRLTDLLKLALSRSDILLLSGGLGPTEDDMTKWAVADVLGVSLLEDEPSRKHLEDFFLELGREGTPNNYRQALFPEGAKIMPNPNGTAPGCICETKEGKLIIILPGPPHELIPMVKTQIVPYLEQKNNKRIKSAMLSVFGKGESALEHELRDLIHEQKNPTIATYAKLGEVQVRVTASYEQGENPDFLLSPVVQEIEKRLGDSVYSETGEGLHQVVARLLKKKGKTISVAESITGGLICSDLVEVPGMSKHLLEGIVTYTNDAKIRLGVLPETLKEHTAVSKETAIEMARCIKVRSGADYGLSATGVAGPGPDADGNPEGLYYIGIVCDGFERSYEFKQGGIRSRLRTMACLSALNELRKELLLIK